MAAKFRIFKKTISIELEKVSIITMTCVLLHNFLRRNETAASIYTPLGTIDICDNTGVIIQPDSWRREIGENCAIRPIERASTTQITRKCNTNKRTIYVILL